MRWFITRFSFPLGFAFVALVCLAASFSMACADNSRRSTDLANWAVALATVGGALFALIGVGCTERRRDRQPAEPSDEADAEA